MEKMEIYKQIEGKFDKFSSLIFSSCIGDFVKIYGEKYLTVNEMIDMLTNNFEKGIVVYKGNINNPQERYDATCDADHHEFRIDKSVLNNKEYFLYVMFHEFIHSISFRKHDGKQYMGFFTLENGEDYGFKSTAFNEVMTEYIALKRKQKIKLDENKNFPSGYAVGVEQLNLLFKIIPEEELTNAFFNNPASLEKIFKKYNMNMDELFYSFYQLEGKENDIKSMLNKRALSNPNAALKVVEAVRYLYYNIFDSFGEVTNEKEFEKKWDIIISNDNDFDLWKLDKLTIYRELLKDAEKTNYTKLDKYISNDELKSYKILREIFNTDDNIEILKGLSELFYEDDNKYFDYVKDIYPVLAYTFLDEVENNYHLYDINLYPRLYKYIKENNGNLDNLEFEKYLSEETNTYIYTFKVNGSTYLETNYTDTEINKINNNLFELKYDNNVDKFDLAKRKYIIQGKELDCKKLY